MEQTIMNLKRNPSIIWRTHIAMFLIWSCLISIFNSWDIEVNVNCDFPTMMGILFALTTAVALSWYTSKKNEIEKLSSYLNVEKEEKKEIEFYAIKHMISWVLTSSKAIVALLSLYLLSRFFNIKQVVGLDIQNGLLMSTLTMTIILLYSILDNNWESTVITNFNNAIESRKKYKKFQSLMNSLSEKISDVTGDCVTEKTKLEYLSDETHIFTKIDTKLFRKLQKTNRKISKDGYDKDIDNHINQALSLLNKLQAND